MRAVGLTLISLTTGFCGVGGVGASSTMTHSPASASWLRQPRHYHHDNGATSHDDSATSERFHEALRLLASVGVEPCTPPPPMLDVMPSSLDFDWLPLCPLQWEVIGSSTTTPHHRLMQQGVVEITKDEAPDEILINFIGAALCVCVAALAAGLTLGMLGMDPLMLLIKERASDNPKERAQASHLLPLVKQHHRLLVTLLLMNSIANEALPIFLEALVPPSVAILVSVTLVLFFGEIIPSAVFTGPNQLAIASSLVPVVRIALFVLAPLAWPIAKLLDYLLHDDQAGDSSAYKRGELSALIRIQYEERLATKRKRKQERQQHRRSFQVGQLKIGGDNVVGALDFTEPPVASQEKYRSVKAIKSHLQHTGSTRSATSSHTESIHPSYEGAGHLQRSDSLHGDEVIMIEGALQMKTSVAIDVYTPRRRIFAVPDTLELSEKAMVHIYASGFSRVPVYRVNSQKPKDHTAIVGVLLTKQLIVLNADDARPISSMPLYIPLCVSPQTPLVEMVNLFQTGGQALKGGHLALVCARPREGNLALSAGEPLPERAGLMGIITLEDVLECLLQEQIYDENDRYERDAVRLARHVVAHWKRYVRRKKQGNPMKVQQDPVMVEVVEDIMDQATETTSLLLGDG